MPKKSPARPGKFRRILKWVLIGGVALAFAGLIALTIAVYTARANLPSFEELKSSPNGQMIRVHAAEGLGIPITGDPVYGVAGGRMMMLHAAQLTVPRPGKPDVHGEAPTPERFKAMGFGGGFGVAQADDAA